VEFERTCEIVLRCLPAAPAVVADVGGGPGRYALWLADLGYRVEHRDLAPGHVEHLASRGAEAVTTRVADARRSTWRTLGGRGAAPGTALPPRDDR
jgi:2-polyprenyl-3-methyl-5-hydroxy-6-metoxy-1,4-benzoquinol methylase